MSDPKSNAIEMAEDLMDIDEAAKLLRKKKSTIYAATSTRSLPFIKRGNRLYFLRSELMKWLLDGRCAVVDSNSAARHEQLLRGRR